MGVLILLVNKIKLILWLTLRWGTFGHGISVLAGSEHLLVATLQQHLLIPTAVCGLQVEGYWTQTRITLPLGCANFAKPEGRARNKSNGD